MLCRIDTRGSRERILHDASCKSTTAEISRCLFARPRRPEEFIHVVVLFSLCVIDWTEERRTLKAERKWGTLSQAQHGQYMKLAAKRLKTSKRFGDVGA